MSFFDERVILATEEVRGARRAICEPCEFNYGGRCERCSCHIGIKVMLNTEQCPERKWKKVVIWRRLRGILK